MEGHSKVVIHDDSLLHQDSGLIIQDGSLLHQHILQNSTRDPDDEMEGRPTAQDVYEEDEGMSSSSYKSFDEHSDADTITAHSHNAVEGDYTIIVNQAQASSSTSGIYRSDQIKAVHPKKKARHGYKQGAAKFRSGQRFAAHEQLSKQVNVLQARLSLAKDSAKAELAGEFDQHIAGAEAQVQAKENARMTEWVCRSISRISCLTYFRWSASY